jgi:hypothetical protein
MRIDLGSENQVLNGSSSSTRPILIVRVILCLPVSLFLIQEILVGGTSRDGKIRSSGNVLRIYLIAIGEIMTHTLLKAAWMLEVLSLWQTESV